MVRHAFLAVASLVLFAPVARAETIAFTWAGAGGDTVWIHRVTASRNEHVYAGPYCYTLTSTTDSRD